MTEFDSETASAFDVLGQEIRIAILEALVQQRAEAPDTPAASFSELRDRVGVADSGQFNYHLGKLTGQFVQKTDAGYELNAAGQEVAGAILSGSFEADSQRGPTELDAPCRECGEPVTVHYEDGKIAVECENGHLNHSDYIPGHLVERLSLPAAMRLATLMGQQDLELLIRDTCPYCYGQIDSSIALADGQPILDGQCRQCGFLFQGPASLVVLTHPVLRAFYLERGMDVREVSLWTLPFLTESDRLQVKSETPIHVEVDASTDGDRLTFLIDEDCSVLEYTADHLSTEHS